MKWIIVCGRRYNVTGAMRCEARALVLVVSEALMINWLFPAARRAVLVLLITAWLLLRRSW